MAGILLLLAVLTGVLVYRLFSKTTTPHLRSSRDEARAEISAEKRVLRALSRMKAGAELFTKCQCNVNKVSLTSARSTAEIARYETPMDQNRNLHAGQTGDLQPGHPVATG